MWSPPKRQAVAGRAGHAARVAATGVVWVWHRRLAGVGAQHMPVVARGDRYAEVQDDAE